MDPSQIVLRVGQRGLREDGIREYEGADQETLGQGHEAGSAGGSGQRRSKNHRR
jgi:hypothetical protein